MELAASPYPPSLLPDPSCQQSKATNARTIIAGTSNSAFSSMSQGFHQGIFGFSDGFDRQTQQDQQQQQETTIYEPGVPGANMLSEMFNFTPSGISATDLLANQISAGYRLHRPPAPAASPGFGGDWYGTAHRSDTATVVASSGSGSGGLGLGPLVDMATKQNHHTIPGLNADSAAAMQLFLMNPQQQVQQPRSPSPPSPAPHAIPLHHDFDAAAAAAAASFAGGVVEGQGLSLSLNSPLQQFEMAKAEELRVRDGLLYYNSHNPLQLQGQQSQQHGQASHVGFSGPMGMVNVLRHSKYARAAQELLEEFCSVGRGQPKGGGRKGKRPSSSNPNPNSTQVGGGGGGASSSSSKDPPALLSPSDRLEHQRRKAKLLSMLDEVDRRYNHYCEQMQMVVNSFDTVMGFGAATPYTGLAQKAMSRHFRCLKDAIAAQLKHTCELLGEKDGSIGSGVTKGETPRLKLLDQSLRHQRSFHQMGMMEQEAWRPQRGLPERSVNILRAWLFEHFLHPYPSDADKHLLARQTGLTRNQVSNWFINARVRLWKPMVEEMYVQESNEEGKEKGDQASQSSSQQLSQAQKPDTSTTTPAETKINHSQLTPLTIPKQQHQPFSSPSSSENPLSVGSGNVGAIAGMELPTAANVGGIDGQMANYGAGMVGSGTQRRFGAPGDVSLTLGLRHAGNTPENSRFSLRDFTGR